MFRQFTNSQTHTRMPCMQRKAAGGKHVEDTSYLQFKQELLHILTLSGVKSCFCIAHHSNCWLFPSRSPFFPLIFLLILQKNLISVFRSKIDSSFFFLFSPSEEKKSMFCKNNVWWWKEERKREGGRERKTALVLYCSISFNSSFILSHSFHAITVSTKQEKRNAKKSWIQMFMKQYSKTK